MEEMKTLFIGILGGVIVIVISWLFKQHRMKSIKEDIALYGYEKKHLEEMKKSSVEMSRSSFRDIFKLFMLMGLANVISSLFEYFEAYVTFKYIPIISALLVFIIWGVLLGLSIRFCRRYENLKNIKSATERYDFKMQQLQNKLTKK